MSTALEDTAQRLFRGLRESSEAYHQDGDYDAFGLRQRALWDEVKLDWRVDGAVLALLRGDLPDFMAHVEAPVVQPRKWHPVGRKAAMAAAAARL